MCKALVEIFFVQMCCLNFSDREEYGENGTEFGEITGKILFGILVLAGIVVLFVVLYV